jgi:flavin-dependent dehydrogenase
LRNAVIIGGGLGGLITSIQLVKAGIPCALLEKKSYPLHRVCGEYISNEAVPFLKRMGLYPDEFCPPQINRFQLSSLNGKKAAISLDLGGFGISRFTFDHFIYRKALEAGVEFYLDTEVEDVGFSHDRFTIKTQVKNFDADIVIGAFGKRSKLDVALNRSFIKKRSPYAGIKYHIKREHADNLISLHNFEGGYCGISNVEGGKTNLCYLTHRENLRRCGSIDALESEILSKNPLLKSIFSDSDFLFKKPEVINEISFETKNPIENHMLMIGDAAGMITPLCGNGMSMAMHASKLVSESVITFCKGKISRQQLEKMYRDQWQTKFSRQLWKGRQIQKLFGNHILSNAAVNIALHVRPVANAIVRNTHGEIF